MSIYLFNEPGCISGIPGTFAGVQVDVDDETGAVRSVRPLSQHSAFVPAAPEAEHREADAPPAVSPETSREEEQPVAPDPDSSVDTSSPASGSDAGSPEPLPGAGEESLPPQESEQ